MTIQKTTRAVKKLSYQLGFHKVGIAKPEPAGYAPYLVDWLTAGKQGSMHWMENYLDKRLDVRKLYPEVRSIVVVALNYYTPYRHSNRRGIGKISRYAWGKDYHKIIKKKLKQLLKLIQQEIGPQIEGRLFVDSAPIHEKYWARQAGIGWQGKNTDIITRETGSWIFLGELLLNRELVYDQPIADFCGHCTACIDACPTQALQPYQLDARKCISYLTIEHWDQPIPEPYARQLNGWIFGCDICQDVCPWNRFAQPSDEERFQPLRPELVTPDLSIFSRMDQQQFKQLFKQTPVYRAKYHNFIRNIKTVLTYISEKSGSSWSE
jgi:epoxyqueuosine reductase